MNRQAKKNWKDLEPTYLKIRDNFLDDPAIAALTNTELGVYLRLMVVAFNQPEKGLIRLPKSHASVTSDSGNSGKLPVNYRQMTGKCLGVDSKNAEKWFGKFEELGLIFCEPSKNEIDCIHFKLMQEPLTDAERKQRERERKQSRQRDIEGHANVTDDVTQESKVKGKHSPKNVFPGANTFLDNKGDISEEVTLGISPLPLSPTETEKEKDAYREKEDILEGINLIQSPSTERNESTPNNEIRHPRDTLWEYIEKYSQEIEADGSTFVRAWVEAETVGWRAESTRCLNHIAKSLRDGKFKAAEVGRPKLWHIYANKELKEYKEYDRKDNLEW